MKRNDWIFAAAVVALFLPFFLSEPLYAAYQSFNAAHGVIMSFLKFAVLSTLGEMLGCRISSGRYLPEAFGLLPKAVVWGVLGIGIYLAMILFSKGTPYVWEALGVPDAAAAFAGPMSVKRVLVAFSVSVAMNSLFGPVFMTFHKLTDMHIRRYRGSAVALIRPMAMGELMAGLDWKTQWGFVFKKTIPLFWFPAHTVTFLLPGELRVLCAALLGIALGVLLALAARKNAA